MDRITRCNVSLLVVLVLGGCAQLENRISKTEHRIIAAEVEVLGSTVTLGLQGLIELRDSVNAELSAIQQLLSED